MPVYSNDDGTSKSVWVIACNAAASFLLAAGTLTADRTLTAPDASGIISIRDDFGANYNLLTPTSHPTFDRVTISTSLDTPLIDTPAGLTIKAGSSPLVLQQGSGSGGVTIFDGATNVGSGIWLLRAATSDESAKFRFFTNGVVKWSTGLLGDSSNDFHIFNEATGATGLKLRSTTNNVEIVSNLLIGGTTVPSGGVSTIVLNGSTLGAASSSDVSIGAPSIGGSRRFGVQAGTGNVISLGADRLNYAASTGYVSIAGTDVITITTSGITLIGALPITSGGTGNTSYANGQLLIGNSTGNTLAKATLTGTSNQVIVTNGAGSITLSTPQSIATSSTVQFASVGIGTAGGTYPLNVQSTGANAPAINVVRAGSGAGNGQWWGFGIDNAAGTDAVFFACASSNYTTGGGSAWVQNSSAYLGYPASGPMLIGPTGGTTYPVLNLATNRFVGINVATPLKPLHLSVSGQCDMLFNETSQGTDLKNWALSNRSQTFVIGTQNDAGNSFSAKITISRAGLITLIDAANIAVGTTTGTKIGTATSQLIGFWNVTPVAQYASAAGLTTGFSAATGTAVLAGSTFTGNTGSTAYTMSEVVRALKLCGIMAA